MKSKKASLSDSTYTADIYRLVYNHYISFYQCGNQSELQKAINLIREYKLDINEQDLLWWKSYKYEKWVKFKENRK